MGEIKKQKFKAGDRVFKNRLKKDFVSTNANDLSELLLIPIFLVILFALTIAQANEFATENTAKILEVTTASTLAASTEELKDERGFSAAVKVEYSSNLYKDSAKKDSTNLIFAPVYMFNSKQGVEGRLDYIKEHQGEQKSHLSNLIIIGTPYTFDLKKEVLSFKPKVGVTAPTDTIAYDDDAFRGAVSLRPTFTWQVQQIKGLTVSNVTYLTKNFHKFEVKRSGAANTEYSFRNRVAINYALTERLALELINDYTKGRTYQGTTKDSFYFGQEIAYEFVKSWSASISHTNEGLANGANNSENNVEIYDERSSTVAVGLGKSF